MTQTLARRNPAITDRQRQVVELIAAGCSNDEVGRRLGISSRTAKAHSERVAPEAGVCEETTDPDRVPGPHRGRPPVTKPRAGAAAPRGLNNRARGRRQPRAWVAIRIEGS